MTYMCMYMYAIKCLALINQDHSCYFFLVHCFENMTSNKETQGFGRVVHVFAIHALVAGEAVFVESESHYIDSKQSSWSL